MSLWQLEYVQYDPRTLPLKFGQDGVSNSYDIQDMDKCRKKKILPGQMSLLHLEYVQKYL